MPRIVRDIQLLVNDDDDHLYGYRLSDGTEVRIGTSRTENAAAVVGAGNGALLRSAVAARFLTGQLQTAAAPTFNTHTWHETMSVDCEFDAVQLVIQNVESSSYTLGGAVVGVSSNITDNVTPTGGWVACTWPSLTIPARIAANRPSITLSDIINLSSLAPTDGSYPYLMVRTYCATGGYSVTGANAAMAQNAQYQGRYFVSYRDGTGDYATTNQAAFTKGTAQNLCHVTGVIFYSRGRVVSVLGVGDSITQGSGVTGESQNGWGPRACAAVSTAAMPVLWSNFGVASQTTAQYFARLETALSAGIRPQIVVYSPFSPNDGTPSQTTVNAQRAYLARFYALADEYRFIPVITTGCPNTAAAWNATADNFRKAFNAELLELRNQGRIVVDFASVLGDGATPERFIPAMTEDGTHPGGAGYAAMATLLEAEIAKIQSAVFTPVGR